MSNCVMGLGSIKGILLTRLLIRYEAEGAIGKLKVSPLRLKWAALVQRFILVWNISVHKYTDKVGVPSKSPSCFEESKEFEGLFSPEKNKCWQNVRVPNKTYEHLRIKTVFTKNAFEHLWTFSNNPYDTKILCKDKYSRCTGSACPRYTKPKANLSFHEH